MITDMWLFTTVFWYLLFPHSSAAILVFWQILTGWSLTSASVFAASFFKTSQLSGVYIVVGFLVTGLGAMLLNAPGSGSILPSTGTTAALTLLFPSFNYMALLGYYARYEVPGLPTDLLKAPTSASAGPGLAAVSQLQGIVMWIFLLIQIIAYPVLAIVLERMLHGVSFGSRTFDASHEAVSSQLVLQTSGLSKTYTLPWYKSLFRCRSGHAGDVHALEDLNMTCQRQQVLCLLGANGSGKTTTLDLVAGLHKPTAGSVTINAPPSHLGVCPQRNVLFSHLTVAEHVWVWSKVKGGREDAAGLAQMIESCDLGLKRNSLAKHLSGGQKRKLQLACMLVGGASLCLMDEVTTGLDPLSRRRIWNIILAERAKRSMVITTHFLDEAEVLADTIAMISRGHLKCLGPPAVLKNQFGGGYRVHAPYGNHAAADMASVDGVNSFIHQDRIVYNMPDATTAAQLMATFTHRGERDVQIAGPTIEDVFMRVSDELPETFMDDPASHSKAAEGQEGQPQLSQAQHPTSFWTQVHVLLHKRTLILRRNWWPYFFVLALPVAITPALNRLLTFYHAPLCVDILADAYSPAPYQLASGDGSGNHNKYSPLPSYPYMVFGPTSKSLNVTLYGTLANFTIGQGFNLANYSHQIEWQDSFAGFQDVVQRQATSLTPGGIWMGGSSTSTGNDATDSTGATIAYLSEQGMFPALSMLNLWSQLQAKMQINGAQQFLSSLFSPVAGSSLQYAAYFCLIQVVYPALFALYPTGERTSRVRALHYSNGVRSLPLWTAYILFDFVFVMAISVCVLLTTWKQLPYWFNVAYFFPVLVLYGLSAMLMSFVVSTLAKSQLAAFATVAGGLGAMFAVTIMSFSVSRPSTPFSPGLVVPDHRWLEAHTQASHCS
jgi:ATP-binding cassette, subfamily A (ABC1), member 3